jgi:F-type H+-transporting ATPase subunit alpha
MFTRFGEQPEPRVKAQIERGRRLRALLGQPQFQPLRVVDQVALALALGDGLFDQVPIAEIAAIRAVLPAWLDGQTSDLVTTIEAGGTMTGTQRSALLAAMTRLIEGRNRGAPA